MNLRSRRKREDVSVEEVSSYPKDVANLFPEQKSPEKRNPAEKQLLNIPGMSNQKTDKTYDYYKQISEL